MSALSQQGHLLMKAHLCDAFVFLQDSFDPADTATTLHACTAVLYSFHSARQDIHNKAERWNNGEP